MALALDTLAACDLCGSSRLRAVTTVEDLALGTPGRHTLAVCEGCGLRCLNPRPAPSEIGQFYPRSYEFYGADRVAPLRAWQRRAGGDERPGLVGRTLLGLRQKISFHHIPERDGGGRLLDVGCGSGAFLDVMKQLGWETHGVEISPEAAATARRKGHHIVGTTIDDELGEPQSYDLVYMWHTLEHTYSPRRALAHVHRVLRPGGRFLVSVPNVGGIQAALFGRFWSALDAPRHLYHFDRRTLRRYLEEAGFEVLRIETRTGATSWVRSLRLLMNHLLGTKLVREPSWLIGLFEIPTFLSGLFGYFGGGRDLRAFCRRR